MSNLEFWLNAGAFFLGGYYIGFFVGCLAPGALAEARRAAQKRRDNGPPSV